ncbi:response regulator [Paramaledivibacter caminithermalis]|jgi:two-component system chemotaxis sensor kinase CheA|uniref:Circadian input-output histidine kinase CikA n=1 Tax=Paramaledivibacter caminithermalis (strain DSM 15212 / CIP 107654 / DViRD3) TaxID=1121301 RepID=A0A1M6NPN3_PARC5|nr:response regulator [Paramaledivibacter caminithermalis]SHJ97655.1 Signal transduction histidine kinase [Paramaledivibacter caminithermalis DSM 15212]
MPILKKFSLATKIAIGFGAVIMILMFTILFGYRGLNKISEDFSHYRKIAKNQILAGEIQTNLLENDINFKNYIVTGDISAQKEFEKNYEHMEELIYDAKNNIEVKERDSKLDLVLKYIQEYKDGFQEIVDYQNKRNIIVLGILTKKGTDIEENLSKIIKLSLDYNNQEQLNAMIEAQRHFLEARLNVGKYLENNRSNFANIVINELSEMDKELKYVNNSINDEVRRERLNLIDEDKSNYISSFKEVVSIIENRNKKIERLNDIGSEISNVAEEIKQSIIEEQGTFGPNVKKTNDKSIMIMLALSFVAIILSILVSIEIIKIVVLPVKTLTDTFKGFSEGEADLKVRLKVNTSDEIGKMASYFNIFMDKLQIIMNESQKQNWLKTGQSELNEKIRGEQDITILANNIITYLCKYLKAHVGAIYLKTHNETFKMISSYAYKKRKNLTNEVKKGEGLVGQCALEKQIIVLSNVPHDYITINSGLGEAVPRNIIVVPCIYHEEINCIVELGSFNKFTDSEIEFLETISEIIAISINTAQSRKKMKELLEQSLKQTEELQLQQEELKQTNEELENQTNALKESEASLQEQQEELRIINEELEKQTKSLKKQRDEINRKNEELEKAQKEIEKKAIDLEIANKYKSEFLANMSHELRTPLNSILILSKLLSNKLENSTITKKELEFANTIYSSGKDLLDLINDILDISKIEAGKMDISLENMNLEELIYDLECSFKQFAIEKGISFKVEASDDLPDFIYTDPQKVKQIVNNLLSNAFKFTEKGGVTVNISRLAHEEIENNRLEYKDLIKIAVTDTGIGIPKDKQEIIFEAFRQSDGTINRKYGGTGLGLSICKELTKMLDGRITLESEEGKGSTFTIILPEKLSKTDESQQEKDLKKIAYEDSNKLVEEVAAASKIKDVESIDNKIGDERNILNEIFRDIKKENEGTFNNILIVEDNKNQRFSIAELFRDKGIRTKGAETGEEAYKLLKAQSFDCIILDLGLKDISGFELLDTLKKENLLKIPVIIYTGKELSGEEEAKLQKYVKTIVVKGPKSMERLMSEVSLFLNSKASKISEEDYKETKMNFGSRTDFSQKKVLIIDDDMRNVFALSSMLEEQNISVIVGKNGKEGIAKLNENPDTDIILMDIMMPEMDGYTAMKEIRKNPQYQDIPIIALTAKAMKDDRIKCIEAGANDYLTKPVETDKINSLLRMWLNK